MGGGGRGLRGGNRPGHVQHRRRRRRRRRGAGQERHAGSHSHREETEEEPMALLGSPFSSSFSLPGGKAQVRSRRSRRRVYEFPSSFPPWHARPRSPYTIPLLGYPSRWVEPPFSKPSTSLPSSSSLVFSSCSSPSPPPPLSSASPPPPPPSYAVPPLPFVLPPPRWGDSCGVGGRARHAGVGGCRPVGVPEILEVGGTGYSYAAPHQNSTSHSHSSLLLPSLTLFSPLNASMPSHGGFFSASSHMRTEFHVEGDETKGSEEDGKDTAKKKNEKKKRPSVATLERNQKRRKRRATDPLPFPSLYPVAYLWTGSVLPYLPVNGVVPMRHTGSPFRLLTSTLSISSLSSMSFRSSSRHHHRPRHRHASRSLSRSRHPSRSVNSPFSFVLPTSPSFHQLSMEIPFRKFTLKRRGTAVGGGDKPHDDATTAETKQDANGPGGRGRGGAGDGPPLFPPLAPLHAPPSSSSSFLYAGSPCLPSSSFSSIGMEGVASGAGGGSAFPRLTNFDLSPLPSRRGGGAAGVSIPPPPPPSLSSGSLGSGGGPPSPPPARATREALPLGPTGSGAGSTLQSPSPPSGMPAPPLTTFPSPCSWSLEELSSPLYPLLPEGGGEGKKGTGRAYSLHTTLSSTTTATTTTTPTTIAPLPFSHTLSSPTYGPWPQYRTRAGTGGTPSTPDPPLHRHRHRRGPLGGPHPRRRSTAVHGPLAHGSGGLMTDAEVSEFFRGMRGASPYPPFSWEYSRGSMYSPPHSISSVAFGSSSFKSTSSQSTRIHYESFGGGGGGGGSPSSRLGCAREGKESGSGGGGGGGRRWREGDAPSPRAFPVTTLGSVSPSSVGILVPLLPIFHHVSPASPFPSIGNGSRSHSSHFLSSPSLAIAGGVESSSVAVPVPLPRSSFGVEGGILSPRGERGPPLALAPSTPGSPVPPPFGPTEEGREGTSGIPSPLPRPIPREFSPEEGGNASEGVGCVAAMGRGESAVLAGGTERTRTEPLRQSTTEQDGERPTSQAAAERGSNPTTAEASNGNEGEGGIPTWSLHDHPSMAVGRSSSQTSMGSRKREESGKAEEGEEEGRRREGVGRRRRCGRVEEAAAARGGGGGDPRASLEGGEVWVHQTSSLASTGSTMFSPLGKEMGKTRKRREGELLFSSRREDEPHSGSKGVDGEEEAAMKTTSLTVEDPSGSSLEIRSVHRLFQEVTGEFVELEPMALPPSMVGTGVGGAFAMAIGEEEGGEKWTRGGAESEDGERRRRHWGRRTTRHTTDTSPPILPHGMSLARPHSEDGIPSPLSAPRISPASLSFSSTLTSSVQSPMTPSPVLGGGGGEGLGGNSHPIRVSMHATEDRRGETSGPSLFSRFSHLHASPLISELRTQTGTIPTFASTASPPGTAMEDTFSFSPSLVVGRSVAGSPTTRYARHPPPEVVVGLGPFPKKGGSGGARWPTPPTSPSALEEPTQAGGEPPSSGFTALRWTPTLPPPEVSGMGWRAASAAYSGGRAGRGGGGGVGLVEGGTTRLSLSTSSSLLSWIDELHGGDGGGGVPTPVYPAGPPLRGRDGPRRDALSTPPPPPHLPGTPGLVPHHPSTAPGGGEGGGGRGTRTWAWSCTPSSGRPPLVSPTTTTTHLSPPATPTGFHQRGGGGGVGKRGGGVEVVVVGGRNPSWTLSHGAPPGYPRPPPNTAVVSPFSSITSSFTHPISGQGGGGGGGSHPVPPPLTTPNVTTGLPFRPGFPGSSTSSSSAGLGHGGMGEDDGGEGGGAGGRGASSGGTGRTMKGTTTTSTTLIANATMLTTPTTHHTPSFFPSSPPQPAVVVGEGTGSGGGGSGGCVGELGAHQAVTSTPTTTPLCAPYRQIAIKVFPKMDLDDPCRAQCFLNEVCMGATLHHPSLVPWFGVADDYSDFFLIMDLLPEGTLQEMILSLRDKPEERWKRAPRLMADIVLALEYLQDSRQHPYDPHWMEGGLWSQTHPSGTRATDSRDGLTTTREAVLGRGKTSITNTGGGGGSEAGFLLSGFHSRQSSLGRNREGISSSGTHESAHTPPTEKVKEENQLSVLQGVGLLESMGSPSGIGDVGFSSFHTPSFVEHSGLPLPNLFLRTLKAVRLTRSVLEEEKEGEGEEGEPPPRNREEEQEKGEHPNEEGERAKDGEEQGRGIPPRGDALPSGVWKLPIRLHTTLLDEESSRSQRDREGMTPKKEREAVVGVEKHKSVATPVKETGPHGGMAKKESGSPQSQGGRRSIHGGPEKSEVENTLPSIFFPLLLPTPTRRMDREARRGEKPSRKKPTSEGVVDDDDDEEEEEEEEGEMTTGKGRTRLPEGMDGSSLVSVVPSLSSSPLPPVCKIVPPSLTRCTASTTTTTITTATTMATTATNTGITTHTTAVGTTPSPLGGGRIGSPSMASACGTGPPLERIGSFTYGGEGMGVDVSHRALSSTEGIVLHRDVKPSNFLLTWDGHLRLGDFGTACFLGDTAANTYNGTLAYMSKEMVVESKAGRYSDLWSAGCILYEILEGTPLFSGMTGYLVMSKIKTFLPSSLTLKSLEKEKEEAKARADRRAKRKWETARRKASKRSAPINFPPKVERENARIGPTVRKHEGKEEEEQRQRQGEQEEEEEEGASSFSLETPRASVDSPFSPERRGEVGGGEGRHVCASSSTRMTPRRKKTLSGTLVRIVGTGSTRTISRPTSAFSPRDSHARSAIPSPREEEEEEVSYSIPPLPPFSPLSSSSCAPPETAPGSPTRTEKKLSSPQPPFSSSSFSATSSSSSAYSSSSTFSSYSSSFSSSSSSSFGASPPSSSARESRARRRKRGTKEAALDLLSRLLQPQPTQRLGSDETGGFAALKAHPFFRGIDWDRVHETNNFMIWAAAGGEEKGKEPHRDGEESGDDTTGRKRSPTTSTAETQSTKGEDTLLPTTGPPLFLPSSSSSSFFSPFGSQRSLEPGGGKKTRSVVGLPPVPRTSLSKCSSSASTVTGVSRSFGPLCGPSGQQPIHLSHTLFTSVTTTTIIDPSSTGKEEKQGTGLQMDQSGAEPAGSRRVSLVPEEKREEEGGRERRKRRGGKTRKRGAGPSHDATSPPPALAPFSHASVFGETEDEERERAVVVGKRRTTPTSTAVSCGMALLPLPDISSLFPTAFTTLPDGPVAREKRGGSESRETDAAPAGQSEGEDEGRRKATGEGGGGGGAWWMGMSATTTTASDTGVRGSQEEQPMRPPPHGTSLPPCSSAAAAQPGAVLPWLSHPHDLPPSSFENQLGVEGIVGSRGRSHARKSASHRSVQSSTGSHDPFIRVGEEEEEEVEDGRRRGSMWNGANGRLLLSPKEEVLFYSVVAIPEDSRFNTVQVLLVLTTFPRLLFVEWKTKEVLMVIRLSTPEAKRPGDGACSGGNDFQREGVVRATPREDGKAETGEGVVPDVSIPDRKPEEEEEKEKERERGEEERRFLESGALFRWKNGTAATTTSHTKPTKNDPRHGRVDAGEEQRPHLLLDGGGGGGGHSLSPSPPLSCSGSALLFSSEWMAGAKLETPIPTATFLIDSKTSFSSFPLLEEGKKTEGGGEEEPAVPYGECGGGQRVSTTTTSQGTTVVVVRPPEDDPLHEASTMPPIRSTPSVITTTTTRREHRRWSRALPPPPLPAAPPPPSTFPPESTERERRSSPVPISPYPWQTAVQASLPPSSTNTTATSGESSLPCRSRCPSSPPPLSPFQRPPRSAGGGGGSTTTAAVVLAERPPPPSPPAAAAPPPPAPLPPLSPSVSSFLQGMSGRGMRTSFPFENGSVWGYPRSSSNASQAFARSRGCACGTTMGASPFLLGGGGGGGGGGRDGSRSHQGSSTTTPGPVSPPLLHGFSLCSSPCLSAGSGQEGGLQGCTTLVEVEASSTIFFTLGFYLFPLGSGPSSTTSSGCSSPWMETKKEMEIDGGGGGGKGEKRRGKEARLGERPGVVVGGGDEKRIDAPMEASPHQKGLSRKEEEENVKKRKPSAVSHSFTIEKEETVDEEEKTTLVEKPPAAAVEIVEEEEGEKEWLSSHDPSVKGVEREGGERETEEGLHVFLSFPPEGSRRVSRASGRRGKERGTLHPEGNGRNTSSTSIVPSPKGKGEEAEEEEEGRSMGCGHLPCYGLPLYSEVFRCRDECGQALLWKHYIRLAMEGGSGEGMEKRKEDS